VALAVIVRSADAGDPSLNGSAMLALVSARAARALDDDLPPLCAALAARSVPFEVCNWDDPGVDWSRYRAALLRSTWDYIDRYAEFSVWIDRVAAATRLLNAPEVVRWNTHKGYLLDLARADVAIVPTQLLQPGDDIELIDAPELVVKPAIGAGSRDARRFCRDPQAARVHAKKLLDGGRDVLIQPYLDRVDTAGETALIYLGGVYSHAIRKGPLLSPNADATSALFAPEAITARQPDAAEHALAERALAAIPFPQPMTYARVDLLRDADGEPVLLELELTEPSLFFTTTPDAAGRFAEVLAAVLAA
jgi:glutathione synthase/RimK-type ligase-like ATP-grasp enzyme